MFNLILFGPPGSGKGTQSEKLIAKYGLKHLSTGDLLRSEIAAKTPLGLEAKNIMDKGQLVPDEVVIGMIILGLPQEAISKIVEPALEMTILATPAAARRFRILR